MSSYTSTGADISDDGLYRYSLWRYWDKTLPKALIIGLNPSTADADLDDPTIRREVDFAKGWGCGGLIKVNLFAFRATDPETMRRAEDPVGPDNFNAIEDTLLDFRFKHIVCAWGSHGNFGRQNQRMRDFLHPEPLECFGLTAMGHPQHPLYLKRDTPLVPYEPPAYA